MAKKKKSKETKAKFTKKEVKAMVMVAEEMNNIMGLVPEIEVDPDEPEAILEGITTNAEDIHPVKDEDDFSEKAWEWLGTKDLIPEDAGGEEDGGEEEEGDTPDEDDVLEVIKEGQAALETFLEKHGIEDDIDLEDDAYIDLFYEDGDFDDDEDPGDLVAAIIEALPEPEEDAGEEEEGDEKIVCPGDWDDLLAMDGSQLEDLEVQEELEIDSEDFDLEEEEELATYREGIAKELEIEVPKKKKKKKKKKKGAKDDGGKKKKKKKKGAEEEEGGKKKKKKKGKPVVAAKGKKTGLGVIAFICKCLKEDGPITKKAILKKMVKEFPDRNEKAMMSTLNVQVPGKINREKDFNIVETEDGWEVEEEKKKKKKKKKSSKDTGKKKKKKKAGSEDTGKKKKKKKKKK